MMPSDPSSPSGSLVAGRYRLESVVGRGGMGVVWRAVDTLIERTVALKELRAPHGDETAFVERALREARNAGRLNHPGIVAVHDVIAPAGDAGAAADPVVYIVMEYVEAPSLADVIDRQGPLRPDRAAAMGLGILDALTAAHGLGVVHRDVKPGNVMVLDGARGDRGDLVKLTDFGIALAAEDTRLTRSGVMGTHAYLAPECFDDGQVGPATDLWALGATLFHAVAGRAPFDRETTTATLRAILFEEPPPPPCGPPLADAITGLLTRPVGRRLSGPAAREVLQRAAATPSSPPTPAFVTAPTEPGQGPWQAQATNLHRAPAPGPVPPGPGPLPPGPPGPLGPVPPSPPSFAPPAPAAPMATRPPQRNSTPLVLGILGAVAAAVVLVVVLASSGGSGDDDGGSVAQQDPSVAQDPAASANPLDPGAAPTDPALAEGQAFAQEVLDLVNGGDAAAATAMLCTVDGSEEYADDITDAAGNVALQIDPETAELVSQGVVYSADLTGTLNGDAVERAHIGVAARDNCIVTFSVR